VPNDSSSAVNKKSIAVRPFENLSRDPDNAYFVDGIQDEILMRLAKIADLKVTSRTSTRHFKSSPDNLPPARGGAHPRGQRAKGERPRVGECPAH
jgi:TolB-like protein